MSEDGKLVQLQEALRGLTGLDPSLTGRFSSFHDREDLTFFPFSDYVLEQRDFAVTNADTGSPELEEIRAYVDGTDQGIVLALRARISRAAAAELVFNANHDMAEKIAAIQFRGTGLTQEG
jgi:hypothetical protein